MQGGINPSSIDGTVRPLATVKIPVVNDPDAVIVDDQGCTSIKMYSVEAWPTHFPPLNLSPV